MKVVEQRELQKLVERISLEFFYKPFRHKATFNKRLRTTGGRYLLGTHNIELSWFYYQSFGEEELVGVMKHELCHYHLHLEGRGYQHRDADFKYLMKQVGAPRFCKAVPRAEIVYKEYQCVDCAYSFYRKRRVNTQKYVCGKCRGKIVEKNNE